MIEGEPARRRLIVLVRRRERGDAQRGASAVEYGLLIAAVAAVIVTAVFIFGTLLNDLNTDSCQKLNSQIKNADVAAECQPPAPPLGPDTVVPPPVGSGG